MTWQQKLYVIRVAYWAEQITANELAEAYHAVTHGQVIGGIH